MSGSVPISNKKRKQEPSQCCKHWALISDIHFQDRGLNRLAETINWFLAEISQNGIEQVFILGDTLNTRSSISVLSLSAAASFLNNILNIASMKHIHVLIGNHDMCLKYDGKITSLDLLTLKPINNTVTLYKDITLATIDNHPVLFIPYHENQNEIVTQLQQIEQNDANFF